MFYICSVKKLFAYSVLALLLYNALGYYALVVRESVVHTTERKATITDADLKVVKIPVSLYAHIENTEFTFSEKEMTFEGSVYWVVKQRIVNDTLQIYCLHDYKKENINNQLAEAGQVNHKSIPSAPLKWLLKSFLKEFTVPTSDKNIIKSSIFEEKATLVALNSTRALCTQCIIALPTPPPNAVV